MTWHTNTHPSRHARTTCMWSLVRLA